MPSIECEGKSEQVGLSTDLGLLVNSEYKFATVVSQLKQLIRVDGLHLYSCLTQSIFSPVVGADTR